MERRTAIITGASRGIGRAICLELANDHTNIVINYSGDLSGAEETKRLAAELGASCICVQADVSKYEEAEKLFAACNDAFGPAGILINNAGITKDNLLLRISDADFDRVLAVNLKSAFNCMKLAVGPMGKKRKGRIVSISSVVGLSGNAGQANYAASKAGIIGLTKSVAKEYAKRGVTVNAIAPGFVETNMTEVLPQDVKGGMLAAIPMNRFGRPEDIAKAAAFLVSDHAAFITGQVLSVDGGMHM